jgi:Fe2+ or Zn2+ uptake regulation protein
MENSMKTIESPSRAIKAQGYRLTRQRSLVVDILNESTEHLDAETIYQRAKERDARISLATVYRSLALLKQTGMVQEHNLGEDHGHFETTQPSPHYHFTCQRCGRVVEFEAPQVMEVARRLSDTLQVRVIQVQLLLRGFCCQCRPGEIEGE